MSKIVDLVSRLYEGASAEQKTELEQLMSQAYDSGLGVKGDSLLAHIGPTEFAMLYLLGGAGKPNPNTGYPSFYNEDADRADEDHNDPDGYSGPDGRDNNNDNEDQEETNEEFGTSFEDKMFGGFEGAPRASDPSTPGREYFGTQYDENAISPGAPGYGKLSPEDMAVLDAYDKVFGGGIMGDITRGVTGALGIGRAMNFDETGKFLGTSYDWNPGSLAGVMGTTAGTIGQMGYTAVGGKNVPLGEQYDGATKFSQQTALERLTNMGYTARNTGWTAGQPTSEWDNPDESGQVRPVGLPSPGGFPGLPGPTGPGPAAPPKTMAEMNQELSRSILAILSNPRQLGT